MAARARTRLLELIAMPNGRCAPHPPIAASLLLIRPPKINKIYRTRAARVKGFPEYKCFSSSSNLGLPRQGLFFPLDHRGSEIGGPLPPVPPIAASLILPAMFWGQNYVPVRPYALTFFVFPFFDLLILLFLSLLSFLILLVLFFVFLFFFSYILICSLYYIHAD